MYVYHIYHNPYTPYIPYISIHWVVPLPSNSDHQDYYIFSRESLQTFISTITGKGDNPIHTYIFTIYIYSMYTTHQNGRHNRCETSHFHRIFQFHHSVSSTCRDVFPKRRPLRNTKGPPQMLAWMSQELSKWLVNGL